MKIYTGQQGLLKLVQKQINTFFGLSKEERKMINNHFNETIKRVSYCFEKTPNKYYHQEGQTYFNPYHSGQYSIFLYFLSNTISKNETECISLADKIYYLNKALNGFDLFHQVQMPDIFFLDHPIGSVIGRAVIGNYFSFAQNCTVGNNKGIYPIIGEHVRMTAHAAIIGKCNIGDYVIVAAGTIIKDIDVPAYSLVFGHSNELIIKTKNKEYMRKKVT
jgi:serine O-acetyltransferase